ncbi:hypothetical protein E2C01_037220 [Portunus trituberculatus]|uniref:Reverse transcriptase domain-containing protein n=1 Tax=Portunus trituberculatus TaxID=210409 RepID=A0A5B7F7J6_PORTR|nr:hypothetical protein [Portunus trituberculatus]
MWAFHGNLWVKGDTVLGTSYLKAHPLGNCCQSYTRTVDRIRTRSLEDPSDPKARMAPLYHGSRLNNAEVPQGSVLFPTLYNMYTANLPRLTYNDSLTIQYADDVTQLARARSLSSYRQNSRRVNDNKLMGIKMARPFSSRKI